jgi:hypothetical protein
LIIRHHGDGWAASGGISDLGALEVAARADFGLAFLKSTGEKMPLPPASLVQWTEYLLLLVTLIAAVRTLGRGGAFLSIGVTQVKPRE